MTHQKKLTKAPKHKHKDKPSWSDPSLIPQKHSDTPEFNDTRCFAVSPFPPALLCYPSHLSSPRLRHTLPAHLHVSENHPSSLRGIPCPYKTLQQSLSPIYLIIKSTAPHLHTPHQFHHGISRLVLRRPLSSFRDTDRPITGDDHFAYALSSNQAWAGYKNHQNPTFFPKLAAGQSPTIRTRSPHFLSLQCHLANSGFLVQFG